MMEMDRDYSQLAKEITEKTKFEAKMHSDAIIQASKQALDIEKVELKTTYQELQYENDQVEKQFQSLRWENFFFRWRVITKLKTLQCNASNRDERQYQKLHKDLEFKLQNSVREKVYTKIAKTNDQLQASRHLIDQLQIQKLDANFKIKSYEYELQTVKGLNVEFKN